ncbi:hypothetical protein [Sagittula stellata]|uniref:Uncharacterized protein n=1 Tax=Sagittula stellata (strain ATCC 700073 / DSM 11524 / E-37) TaxID=388399 RepID=A3JZ87_SAGS3|nr:hypothetical protein [Sagittula stellata]EBA09790.1 hypothetical protein SSE37_08278 [Sagittula stellata E-37]
MKAMAGATEGHEAADAVELGQVRHLLVRIILLCAGMGLMVSAFGIWLVGGGHGPTDLRLIKMGVSLFMLIMGMSMIVLAKSPASD